MNIEKLQELQSGKKVHAVNFVESGCGPFVIEVEFKGKNGLCNELLKNKEGQVISCNNLQEGYAICQQIGLHEANLVQIVPHDEACTSEYADYHKERMPLRF
jgi:hypothetical protein